MTDLHSHILPFMDDGAKNAETARQLLRLEQEQGVNRIALTSHFDCNVDSVQSFLTRRADAYERLMEQLGAPSNAFCMKLGSEVMYAPGLNGMPIHKLCLEGTNILMLELPTTHRPAFVDDFLSFLQAEEIIPMLAHVERYEYVRKDPGILAAWIEMGAYAQINAASVLMGGGHKTLAVKLLKWNLAHVIATDTHSLQKRPPLLLEALQKIESQLGAEKRQQLQENADALFHGDIPVCQNPHTPRSWFGVWL